MRVTLNGRPRPGVTPKDIALHIIGRWGADGGQYRSVEFAGDALAHFSLDERLAALEHEFDRFSVKPRPGGEQPSDAAIAAATGLD